MQTYSGVIFHPLDPKPETIIITDIAAALSKMCRFGGHCSRFYSVAEHCIHVARHAPVRDKLTALLHDASEAYLVDIPRPIKPQLANYYELENALMEKISKRFGTTWPLPAHIKVIDTMILTDERDQNMAFMDVEPQLWGNVLPALGVRLNFLNPNDAFQEFMAAFHTYGGK
jgi:hypothetical protein